MGYTKLFGSLVTSTIWREDNDTRIVWITLLALSDAAGRVEGSIPGLAHIANVPLENCEKALKKLLSPDPYSRTKEHEGRRIAEIDGGWEILNYIKYREKTNTFDRDYFRAKQQEHRAKQKEIAKEKEQLTTTTYTEAEVKRNLTKPEIPQQNQESIQENPKPVDNVKVCQTLFDNQPKGFSLQEVKDACTLIGIPESEAQAYYDNFDAQGWKRGNGQEIIKLGSHINRMWDKVNRHWVFDKPQQDGKEHKSPPPKVDKDGLTARERYDKQQAQETINAKQKRERAETAEHFGGAAATPAVP